MGHGLPSLGGTRPAGVGRCGGNGLEWAEPRSWPGEGVVPFGGWGKGGGEGAELREVGGSGIELRVSGVVGGEELVMVESQNSVGEEMCQCEDEKRGQLASETKNPRPERPASSHPPALNLDFSLLVPSKEEALDSIAGFLNKSR